MNQKGNTDILICYGEYAESMGQGFGDEAHCYVLSDRQSALDCLLQQARAGDIILFKGSHAMECDQLLKDFVKRWNNK